MKIVVLIMALLMIPSAFALFGGENATIFESECVGNVSLNLTSQIEIDDGEFTLSNCTTVFNSSNVYAADCFCGGVIILETLANTINEYYIIMNYLTPQGEQKEETISTGGGKRENGRGGVYWGKLNDSNGSKEGDYNNVSGLYIISEGLSNLSDLGNKLPKIQFYASPPANSGWGFANMVIFELILIIVSVIFIAWIIIKSRTDEVGRK